MLRTLLSLAAVSIVTAMTSGATAQDAKPPRLQTNQAYVEEVTRPSALAIADPMAVFAYVLGSLPERVKVYPTENHYYFAFLHNGTRYAGNIKIDARLRDQGKVTFVYYQDVASLLDDSPGKELRLDASRGVVVEKVGPLAYRLIYAGKSVVFELNDLSQVKPPAAALGPDETFIGPIFDESAIRFFLIFNSKLKIFLYVLDETVKVADELVATKRNDRILVGRRSGFAFYRDHRRNRKILIGVIEDSVRANNYFDGPFDQMPDNFHQGETFRQALYARDPDLKGEIDRFGAFPDGARYAIVPYMDYSSLKDLDVFHRCATSKRVPAADYYRCFVLAPGPERGAKARPLAMPQRSR